MQKWGQQRERIEHDKENAPLKWKCLKKKNIHITPHSRIWKRIRKR